MVVKRGQLAITLIAILVSSVGVGCAKLNILPTPCATSDMVIACGKVVEKTELNIQRALLVLPDECWNDNCFWEIEPGQTTYREFKEILLEIHPDMRPIYQDDSIPLAGVHGRVSFSAGVGRSHSPDDYIEAIDIYVYPDTTSYDVEKIAPPSIISYFGAPDDIYVWAFPDDNFALYILYRDEAFLYEVRAAAHDQELCLSLDNVEYFSLRRFDTLDTALWYIDFRSLNASEVHMGYFQESAEDLPGLAESDSFCLTLKP